MVVSRPLPSYLIRIAWLLLATYRAFTALTSMAQAGWILVGLLGLASLGHVLVRRNYFELKDNEITIYRGLLRNISVKVDQIERVDTEYMPFTNSKIILKNKQEITFHYNEANATQLKEMMSQLNVPLD